MIDKSNIIAGNYYDKQNTKNPIEKYLVKKFNHSFRSLLGLVKPRTVLEIGCAEGHTTKLIRDFYKGDTTVCGIDISPEIIETASRNYPEIEFSVQSACALAFDGSSFDLVIASETLEHIKSPEKALAEAARVGRQQFIFTVPNEPLWRIMNLCRLKYMKKLGNTPGHLHHWNSRSFSGLISGKFVPVKILKPVPYIQMLCERRTE
ncbi:MAG: class I SAM-dependent methyltransferase [Elusimicrobiota bacterium]